MTFSDLHSLRSYGSNDKGARKFGSQAPNKLLNSKGNIPHVGEQIVSGRHLRDKSFD